MNSNVGFAVHPKTNCPHVIQTDHIGNINDFQINIDHRCSDCPEGDGIDSSVIEALPGLGFENWICLKCGYNACSRYVNSHALAHFNDNNNNTNGETNKHLIAISLSDLSVWCYSCDSYITSPILKPLIKYVHDLKFGSSNTTIATSSSDPLYDALLGGLLKAGIQVGSSTNKDEEDEKNENENPDK